eukprot:TRINITY_DN1599_c0_g2_i13.p1 TRINITY_DN1599_c0_g2~~TRINITY_DN1599_c0_g2_i13.p1  ORF type:complete len:257 (-),score=20.94 TRINITY_DN1599_c0_g2_i13:341-1111(-)
MLHPYDTSMGTQLFYLIQRVFLSWLRNPLNFFGRLLVFTQLGLFMGLLYLKIHFTQESLQDRISALAFCSIFLMFMPMCAIEIFLEDRDIFLRERMNGYYTVLPYVLANTIVSNMFIALCCCVFSGIVYVLIGFNPSISAFGYFALNLIVTLWCSEGVTTCISTLVSSPVIGIAIICCFLGLLVLTNGFFLRAINIPAWWIWLHYVDYSKYFFEGSMVSEFTGLNFPCIPVNSTITGSILREQPRCEFQLLSLFTR